MVSTTTFKVSIRLKSFQKFGKLLKMVIDSSLGNLKIILTSRATHTKLSWVFMRSRKKKSWIWTTKSGWSHLCSITRRWCCTWVLQAICLGNWERINWREYLTSSMRPSACPQKMLLHCSTDCFYSGKLVKLRMKTSKLSFKLTCTPLNPSCPGSCTFSSRKTFRVKIFRRRIIVSACHISRTTTRSCQILPSTCLSTTNSWSTRHGLVSTWDRSNAKTENKYW